MKKIFLALAMVAFITTGAFAQLVFGVSGNQYVFEDEMGNIPSLSEVFDDFSEGTGTYWGVFGEIILGKLGIGLAFNYQDVPTFDYYDDYFGWVTYPDMWSYDVNIYASYHLFGGRAFLDPFVQAGFGMNAYDFKNQEDKTPDNSLGPDDPMFASAYTDFGAGLGLNLGSVGIFFKGTFIVPMEGTLTGTYWDEFGGGEYEIMPWYMNGDFKYTFGAKLIL